jgi:hypothetical protein
VTGNIHNHNLAAQIPQQSYPTAIQMPQFDHTMGQSQHFAVDYPFGLDYIPQILETPSEHAAGIEKEDQQSIGKFIEMGRKTHVQKWADAIIDPGFNEFETVAQAMTRIESMIKYQTSITLNRRDRSPIFTPGYPLKLADRSERPYNGFKYWRSPEPSELPIPSFYKNK